MGHLVTPSFGFVVGDGEKVKFWKDKWCETIPLCEAFPSLFALASNKEAWVNEVWTAEGERGEVGTLVSIDLSTIGSWKKWKGCFFAWRGRRTMQSGSLAFSPSKIIWNSCVQPKLSLFAWEASWGRVLTLDRLQKRGNPFRMEGLFCGKEEEGGVAIGTIMLVLGYVEG
ncbi:hypothetical protein CK203_036864 [Vitis vinifera]|uniref:Reverse transcriptase zinc-binding domain-containing protein n=1 Tax=Vitis vinifera TaxID=29760 RepID=A0A438GXR1_VITVI|nr:hypothetical protein CK203_036864 [Vitis vinifera]